jgi:DNA mismatch repair protein MutS
VVRVVTPGTLTDTELLSDKSEAILLSLHIAPRNACGMAWLSVTQGILHLAECTHDELAAWLERIAPSELLVSASITPKWEQQLQSMRLGQRGLPLSLTLRPDFQYESGLGHGQLIKQLSVANLAAWDADKLSHAHAAAGALLTYAEHTQGRTLPHVSQLKVQKANELIDLPTSTRRNLELTQTLRGEDSPTLFSLLDTCMTGMGSRQLKQWLLNPPRDRQVAVERLAALDQLNDNSAAAQSGVAIWARLREQLKGASDVERITARIALKQARPRELVALKNALIRSASLSHHLQETLGHLSPTKMLHDIHFDLQPPVGLTEILQQALLEEPSNLIRDGGVMANGLDSELDELRAIQTNCDDFLLELETREKARTGIANLKVQFNRVHGFYIEVTQGQIDKVPDDYRRRQTLKNAERFITPELKAFEDKALSAQERALAREKYLYELLLDQLQTHVQTLTKLAQAMAALDALCTLTERATTLDWCAPQFAKEPCIEIRQGRHPVVEARLAETSGGSFIANDCLMHSKQRLQIITGPNMGGKSTYMRQVALIVLLASIGSHVPASSCRLGPIDAIHTRIGAADDLANAQSTFMLEMTEAAQILHSGTPLSLVLMDEIGRGTSTFDGLALASGIATHLHDKTQAFSLFATHYFELTEFPATHHAAVNMHVGATESGNDIVFLHELQAGPASKSYGVQVARLAGMPTSVLNHARHTLTALEAGANENRIQVDLFAPPPESEHAGPTALEAALNQIDPDALSPREALEALYSLQRVLKRSEN